MAFTGLMNYYPNDHGALYFLDKIFPLILSSVPGARIFIVGAKPSRRLQRRVSKNVIITSFVEDVRPFVARAQIAVIPILIGEGTRLKALELMAMKKPIVSTTIRCEGINLTHEESALFADTAEDFAKAVVRLFDDASLRARLAQKAYANVVEQYGWDAIGRKLDGCIKHFLTMEGRATIIMQSIKCDMETSPSQNMPHHTSGKVRNS
ncbi:MAG: glycosyltransferase, partial [Ignavibacteria bacterium]|nr:glycosyltransferase [Ignavibacteria bacterium]